MCLQIGHRIHIPLIVPEGISFEVCQRHKNTDCSPISTSPGAAFEVNNQALHRVLHHGVSDRIHMILDACEAPLKQHRLQAGDSCAYRNGEVVCS